MHSLLTLFAAAAERQDINGDVKSLSIRVIGAASLALVVLLVLAAITVKNKRFHSFKTPLFVAIAATIIVPSLLLVGSTIYVNVQSESKGPVHWHTDIEFWVCGQEIELRDPYEFLSNKVGTSTYHEHDDKRIHLEGVVFEKSYDASLEKFMIVTGGGITDDQLVIPTDPQLFENDVDGDTVSGSEDDVRQFVDADKDGRPTINVRNGDRCNDSSDPGEIQAFLMRFDGTTNTYEQIKLEDPKSYLMRDESIVPPGDCLIVEFGPSKDFTDKLCQQYGVRDAERCTEFGVSEYNEELCNIRQVRDSGQSDEDDASAAESQNNQNAEVPAVPEEEGTPEEDNAPVEVQEVIEGEVEQL